MSGGGLEIERKYLLSAVPAAADLAALGAQPARIEQAYLRSSDGWVRRIRRLEAGGQVRHVLTRKRELRGIVREEHEVDLSPGEYRRLLAEADPARRVIRKVRYAIRAGRWTLELDVFAEPPDVVLLEVELEDAEEVPVLPPAIEALVVREVSIESAYTNHHLALRSAGEPDDEEDGPAAGEEDAADALPPSEAARARRRDRDAEAPARKGMRTGLAKQFKQVLDAQARRGREGERPDAESRPATDATRSRRRPKGDR